MSAQSSEDRAYVGFSLARGTAIGSNEKLDERRQMDLRVPLPPVFLGKTILLPSLGYETHWLGLEPRGAVAHLSADELGRRFHRIQLGLSLMRPLAPRWMLLLGASGGTRTDFRGPFDLSKDTSWVGLAMANYMIGGDPGLRLTLGLIALWPFNRIPVFPVVGFSYRKDPYIMEIGVTRFTLMRRLGEGLELGLSGIFEQQAFHARFPVSGQELGAHYVRETSLRVAPITNIRLGGGSFWLSSSVGLDFLNDYALLDSDRDRLELGDIPTRPAPYVRLSLIWRPPRRGAPTKASSQD